MMLSLVMTTSFAQKVERVWSYGLVDLEGAKIHAVIVEYDKPVKSSIMEKTNYNVEDFVIRAERHIGYDRTIEKDGDSIRGNEGQIIRRYVNDVPEPAKEGKKSGKYVVLEVNSNYLLSGQNLPYKKTMKASAIIDGDTIANDDNIILPQFGKGSGWTMHYVGKNAFHATHCYSEYTGKYYDFDLPYSIYVPDKETLEADKGNIALVLHMEHAGANDSDPYSAITSSMAAVKLSDKEFQKRHPAIVVVPQVEETRRTTNDFDASSEANTAVWELMDSLLMQYKGYINEDRIYGTGMSMGGMCILYMNAQRDNFFGGIAVFGSQWSNNYDKPLQNNGSPIRSPKNDPISFKGFGLDSLNFQNWYFMVSDDNILVHTCKNDIMSTSEWKALDEYFNACGVDITKSHWDPYLPVAEQDSMEEKLLTHDSSTPGSGINWVVFDRGNHMATWKYGMQLNEPFEWLFKQSRKTENNRGKIEQLKSEWLGRDADGKIKQGSGTAHLNSAQYTPFSASRVYVEGWTKDSVK